MSKKLILYWILVWILLVATNIVQASPVTIHISGVVTDVRDLEDYPYSDTVYAGVAITGTYTFDSTTVDSNSQDSIGSYVHGSPYGFNISIGGFQFKTAESHIDQFAISIYNDYSLQTYDRYIIESIQNAPLSTGLNVGLIGFGLSDYTHTAISTTVLFPDAPDLDAWGNNAGLYINCGGPPNGNPTFVIWAAITEAVLIPEPATLALLGLGGLLLRPKRS